MEGRAGSIFLGGCSPWNQSSYSSLSRTRKAGCREGETWAGNTKTTNKHKREITGVPFREKAIHLGSGVTREGNCQEREDPEEREIPEERRQAGAGNWARPLRSLPLIMHHHGLLRACLRRLGPRRGVWHCIGL